MSQSLSPLASIHPAYERAHRAQELQPRPPLASNPVAHPTDNQILKTIIADLARIGATIDGYLSHGH